MSNKYDILGDHTAEENDAHLWWLVQQQTTASIAEVLPVCSVAGRKNALEEAFKSEWASGRMCADKIVAYCLQHNEFNLSEMHEILDSVVFSNIKSIVEMLVDALGENVDVKILRSAVQVKNMHATHLLLDVLGCTDAHVFQTASLMGMADVVERMLPFCDPKENDSFALFNAVRAGQHNCIDVLYAVSDTQMVVNRLNKHFPQTVDPVWEAFKARVQRDVLEQHVDLTPAVAKSRKI